MDRPTGRRDAPTSAGSGKDAKKKRPPVRLGKIILEHLRRWHREDGQGGRYVVHFDGRKLDGVRYTWENAVAEAGTDREGYAGARLRH